MIGQTRQEMDKLILSAGFGAAKMSSLGYTIAKYYHWILAAFTVAVILLEMLPLVQAGTVALWIGLYLIYFAARQLMGERARTLFYQPEVQLLRAQLGVLVVSFLIYSLGRAGASTTLWLLFVLVLQAVSKHCRSWAYVLMLVESWLAILLLAILALGSALWTAPTFTAEVAVPCLWLGILSFIIHYLIRNVDVRTETIARYELVNTLSGRLESLENPDAKWQAVLQTCVQVVQGRSGTLWFCDYNTQTLRLVVEYNERAPLAGDVAGAHAALETSASLASDHLLAQVARNGKPCYYVTDGQRAIWQDQSEIRVQRPQAFQNLYSVMSIPITDDGTSPTRQTLAVLCVGFERSAPPRQTLLTSYQTLLSNMVHYIKPILHYERTVQELKALQQIGSKASRAVELNQVLESILHEIVATLGFEFATVSLVDENEQLIRTVKGINVPDEWIETAVHPLHGRSIRADIVHTGKTEVIEEWDDRFDRRIWERFDHKNAVRVFSPIVTFEHDAHQEKVIGTVEAGYWKATRSVIDEQQLAMLQSFITQAAIAIEKAQLFERMNRRNQALTSLHRVGQSIGVARALPQVLQEIGVNAERVLGADIVMLYRYNEEEHRLQSPLITGTVWGNRPLSLDIKEDGVLAKIIREKASHLASDALADPYLTDYARPSGYPKSVRYRSFTQRQNIKSFAGVPLLANGHIVGVMCVNYRKRHQFANDEQQILELFAQQAAIAIKNAEVNELTHELAAREERSRLSRELHDSISQYLPAISLMADNARALLIRDPARAQDWLDKIQLAAHAASSKVDFAVFQLRSVGLKDSLPTDMGELSQLVDECFGLEVELDIRLTCAIPPSIEEAVYLIVKEALINSARHAHARQACIKIALQHGSIYFWVRDDGCGFDSEKVDERHSHGITSMRERTKMLGGRLHIGPTGSGGTIVVGQLPLGRNTDERETSG